MYKFGLIDRIIEEPLGGAHRYQEQTMEIVKKAVLEMIEELSKLDSKTLKQQRIEKFSKMGEFEELK